MSCDDCPTIEKNICLPKGADYSVSGQILDDNDNNVDISTATIRAQVWDFAGGTKIADFTFTIFSQVVGGETKWFYTRKMAQSVINAITQTEGVWDQFIEYSATNVVKMFEGSVKIKLNATTPTVTP